MFHNFSRTIVFIILIFTINNNAFSQNWSWAKSHGSSGSDVSEAVTSDASGNVYLTGDFKSTSINFASFSLVNAGNSDFYIAKYDPLGNILWAKSSGSSLNEKGMAVATDHAGNVIVAGYFESDTLVFGNDTIFNAGFNSKDIFMVKYDSNGNVIWGKSAGGNSNDLVYSIVTGASGEIYVAGNYVSATFTLDTTVLPNAGDYDAFVAKFDSSGNLIWAKSAGEINADYAYSVAVDASGSVIVGGYFYSSSLTFDTATITNAGSSDIFIVKYDVNGNVQWALSEGGTGQEISYSVSVDEAENIYLSGHFSSQNLVFGNTTLSNVGTSYNVFLAKFNSSGNSVWAKGAGQNGIDYALSVASKSGSVCLAGYFYSPSITFGNITLNNGGDADMYVCKYDTAGNAIWANSVAGSMADYPTEVAIDISGNIIVCGYYLGALNFGLNNLTSSGGVDLYLAKIDDINNSVLSLNEAKTGIYVTPNPFHQNSKIVLPDHIENATISIFDLTGRFIKNFVADQNSELSADNLIPGIYMFKVFKSGGFIGSGKFIIE